MKSKGEREVKRRTDPDTYPAFKQVKLKRNSWREQHTGGRHALNTVPLSLSLILDSSKEL